MKSNNKVWWLYKIPFCLSRQRGWFVKESRITYVLEVLFIMSEIPVYKGLNNILGALIFEL